MLSKTGHRASLLDFWSFDLDPNLSKNTPPFIFLSILFWSFKDMMKLALYH